MYGGTTKTQMQTKIRSNERGATKLDGDRWVLSTSPTIPECWSSTVKFLQQLRYETSQFQLVFIGFHTCIIIRYHTYIYYVLSKFVDPFTEFHRLRAAICHVLWLHKSAGNEQWRILKSIKHVPSLILWWGYFGCNFLRVKPKSLC